MEVRCPNHDCGHVSTLGDDPLGRIFRCTRCRTRLSHRSSGSDFGRGGSLEERAVDASHITVITGVAADSLSGDDGLAWDEGSPLDWIPTRLGRFQIREALGSGTFATVYRAFDPDLEREVALKVPHAAYLTERRVVDRFLEEARALARLRHAQIVPIYEVGRDGAYHYFAMALIEGRSLDALIKRGPISYRRSARIVCDLAHALAYAHDHGIVHRDVKPANILLDLKARANLTDFGLAHRLGSAVLASRDRAGAIIGTPAYLAPEQAQGGTERILPATDQYSLGVVFYELLCGRPPFSGSPPLVLSHAIHREPPRPRSIDPQVPPYLEGICLRALAKRPEDRFASCQTLADELRRWLTGTSVHRQPRTSCAVPA